MGKVENGDIVLHPKGKAVTTVWPWNTDKIELRPLSNEWDLGMGAGQMITISQEEALNYEKYRRGADNSNSKTFNQ